MNYSYGDTWNARLKAMIEPLTEEQARGLYSDGQLVVAAGEEPLLEDWEDADPDDLDGEVPAAWSAFIGRDEPAMVRIKFHDFWGTREAEYIFDEIDGRLFLSTISTFEFANTSEWHPESTWTRWTSSVFNPDGTSSTQVTTLGADDEQHVECTDHTGGDFSATHWEDWPEFGDWASLTRRPRV